MTTTGASKARSYAGDYMDAGRIAEHIFLNWLASHPDVDKVDDLRELPEYQDVDVDFRVTMRGGRSRELMFEVKYDQHLGVSGNVLFELMRLNVLAPPEFSCVLGWSAKSPATHFVYYAPASHQLYVIRAGDLRKALQHYASEHRGQLNMRWVETDEIKATLIAFIPWEYAERSFRIYSLPDDWRPGQAPA